MGSYYSFKKDFDKVLECYKNDLMQHGKSKESDTFFLEYCLSRVETNSYTLYE